MCGRFTRTLGPEELAEVFGASLDGAEFVPSYNVAPTQPAPLVGLREGGRVVRVARWGLIPGWARDASMGPRCVNARAESVADKPAFRAAFRKRRCLVPADGFYEWKREGSGKRPYHFHRRDRAPFAFAGLWEQWTDPSTGRAVRTFSVVTTTPNALVSPVHDRMPVILPRDAEDLWLAPDATPEALSALLAPYPAEWMDCWPVAARVGSPRLDDPSLVERAA